MIFFGFCRVNEEGADVLWRLRRLSPAQSGYSIPALPITVVRVEAARIIAANHVKPRMFKKDPPIPAQSPTLSPTLSAINCRVSWIIFGNTLFNFPTMSAPTIGPLL